MYRLYRKMTVNAFLGSIVEPCYIQNSVITNRVIKRLMCTCGTDIKVHEGNFYLFLYKTIFVDAY